MTAPAYRFLSLGAGIQSTTLMLLAATGKIPAFDAVIFADPGWESAEVYAHLDRLEGVADQAGMPLIQVTAGDIRKDALDSAHRFASKPLFTLGPNGERGMARRQCTSEYRIRPIKKEVRRYLNYPHPARIPASVYVETAIGISVDEIGRARDSDVGYMRNVFPLIDLGWRRTDCVDYLTGMGWGDTPRSACIGCPFQTDDEWARIKAESKAEWADAVAFDHAIRHGSARANAAGHPLRGQFFLHAARVPLDQVVLRPRRIPDPDRPGCGPFTCPSADPIPVPAAAVTGVGVGRVGVA